MRLVRLESTATRSRRCLPGVWLLLATLVAPGVVAASSDERLVGALAGKGHVLMIRHAEAPGFGDPEAFRLDDCSTQCNLSNTGRDQARAIGDWLRAHGVVRARVYTSEWCRCRDTAELLDLGPVTPLAGLNSFYERPEDRQPNLAALRDFLAAQPRDGELLVLVTHQVTISGVTAPYTDSGHGVLLQLQEGGELLPVAELDLALH